MSIREDQVEWIDENHINLSSLGKGLHRRTYEIQFSRLAAATKSS